MATSTGLPTPSAATSGSGNSNRYCFDVGQFAEEAFDPATFVTAAKEVASLEVLRDHLRSYQKDLREELYEVINRDLADYLKLSSKLSGVEHEVLEIRAPLQELLGGLQEAQAFAASKRQSLHDRLGERAGLRGRRETLQRRLRFLHTLGDVEVALHMPGAPASAAASFGSRHRRPLREPEGLGEGGAALDAAAMAEHCGQLERLAHAWLSLAADLGAFPATEEEDDVPTAGAMGLRLQRAEKALLSHLAGAFRAVVCPKNLVVAVAGAGAEGEEGTRRGGKKEGEEDSSAPIPVNEMALRHCLRAFLVLGRGDEAEKQAARLVMLPFVDLNFTQGRLDGGSRGSCAGLPGIYAACLQHARKNLGAVLALAESLLPPAPAGEAPTTSPAPVGLDLAGNGVWRPVHQALCSRLSSAVFAPGIADILHANYTVSMRFLSQLATLAGPAHEAALRRRLRAHPCTRDFAARWNLPVYFHLRFTEVSATVDQALSLQSPPPQAPQQQQGEEGGGKEEDEVARQLTHPAFRAVWAALKGLWAPTVFLAPLTPRLFKLTLQIVGRFHHWLDEALEQAAKSTTPPSSSPSTSTLLLPADRPDALVTVAWDALLFSGAPAVRLLVAQALRAVAAAKKEEEGGAGAGAGARGGEEEEVARLLEDGLTEAVAPFAALVGRAWGVLQEQLVGQCASALQGVKGITATYRMTNKRPPERACPYVAKVLGAIKALEPDVKGRVPPTLAAVWRAQIVTAVTERYLELTQELLSSVQQMEDALKKRKQRAKGSTGGGGMAAGSSSSSSAAVGEGANAPLSDSEKIQLQLLLDVAAFAGEMSGAGGIAEPIRDCAPYAQLLRAVAPARLLLGRPDVHATLPPAIEAFLASS